MKELVFGHISIVISGIFYSTGWILTYKISLSGLPDILILLSLFTGLCAIILIVIGISKMQIIPKKKIKTWHIVLSCIILFITAYVITISLYNRQPTSELFLIFVWLLLETCSIHALFYGMRISIIQTIISLFLMIISLIIGLVCYTIHYKLSSEASFINGLIPYFVFSSTTAIIAVFIFKRNSTIIPEIIEIVRYWK